MLVLKRGINYLSFTGKMSEILKRDIERAQRVQDNVLTNQYTIEAEAKIRKKVDIDSSIDQLENEMREQISKSLQKSESRLLYFIQKTSKRFDELQTMKKTTESIKDYNQMVTQCEKVRWEFMIHRQAVGFTIRNYQLVTTLYKIPPRIL